MGLGCPPIEGRDGVGMGGGGKGGTMKAKGRSGLILRMSRICSTFVQLGTVDGLCCATQREAARGAQRALWRAVRKVGCFGPVFPMTKVTTAATVFPDTGLLGFFLSPKTHIRLCFTLKMPHCCLNLLFLPCGRMLPSWWVVCRVVTEC